MTRRRVVVWGLLILAVGIGVGIIIYAALDGGDGNPLSPGTRYYIRTLHDNSFTRPDGSVIRLNNRDASHAIFDEDFSRLTIHFIAPGRNHSVTFLTVDHRVRRGTFTASMIGILHGEVRRLELIGTASEIYIRTAISYSVRLEEQAADGGFWHHFPRHSLIASFTPSSVWAND